MEKLGLDPPALQAVHPALIYARIKGYGLSGPYADYRSFDMLAQAAAGLFSLTGDADGPPMRPGGTFGDTATGAHTAMAILAAYVQQQRTGEGQVIEMSMHEVMTMFIRTTGIRGWELDGEPAPRIGNKLGGAPSDMYLCQPFGANDYVFIMVGTVKMWEALCKVIDRLDLLDDPALRHRRQAGGARRAAGRDRRRLVPDEDQARGDDAAVGGGHRGVGGDGHAGRVPRSAPHGPRVRAGGRPIPSTAPCCCSTSRSGSRSPTSPCRRRRCSAPTPTPCSAPSSA